MEGGWWLPASRNTRDGCDGSAHIGGCLSSHRRGLAASASHGGWKPQGAILQDPVHLYNKHAHDETVSNESRSAFRLGELAAVTRSGRARLFFLFRTFGCRSRAHGA